MYRQIVTPDEFFLGQTIAANYDRGNIAGWPGPDIARQMFYLLASQPYTIFRDISGLPIQNNGKAMLYQFTRKLLGKDTRNYPQQIGDCVSFGAKNAIEYLICVQATLGGLSNLFRPIFPPYLYGCGRVFIGHGQIPPSEDGSVGAWQAEAVQKYGTIPSDEPGVPEYSGSVAKQWGGKGPPSEFVTLGKQHPVKSAAKINSWKDMVASITNGYPCTIASNQGFSMEADRDGFHRPRGKWGHQMSVIGVDDTYKIPYGLILNSWGDVHGHLKDFESGEDLPIGVLRARAEVIESMIRQDDTFAYSQLDWFQPQRLPEDLFKLI